jgi:hypothetical protein
MGHGLAQDPAVLEAFAWSESIIADVLQRHYPEPTDAGSLSDQLLRLHRCFWKALIFDSEYFSRKQRRALVEAAFESGVDMAILSDIDDEVMTELLEVVLRRFRTAPRQAREYHLLLMSVAARLRLSTLVDFTNSDRALYFEAAGAAGDWIRDGRGS